MDVKFTDYPFSVTLVFYVIGSDIKIQFDCSEIEDLRLEKSWNDEPLYVALEARVAPPKLVRNSTQSDFDFTCIDRAEYLWEISVFPEANLSIKCLSFSWSVQMISDEELLLFNAS